MKEKKTYEKPQVNEVKLELQISPLGTCDGVSGSTLDLGVCNTTGNCAYP